MDENGRCLPPGEEGELRAYSPYRMMGYLNMPVESKDYFDEEGFGKTGDLATYDTDGRIVVLGRMKDQLRYCTVCILYV